MKTKIIFIGVSVFLYASFDISVTRAEIPDIIISEIQIEGKKTTDEFIELYNPSLAIVSLGGLKLCRKTSSGSFSQIKSFSSTDTINSKSFFLFAHSDSIFANTTGFTVDAKTSSSALASNNSLAVTDSCSNDKPPTLITDSVAWGSGKNFNDDTHRENDGIQTSKSLVRDLETRMWSISATPTPTNSHGETYLPPVPIDAVGLRINELLPNPEGDDNLGEFIELYNGNDKDIDLEGFFFEDSSGDQYEFPKGDIIKSKALFVIACPTLTLTLVNSNQTISLFDPDGKLVNSATYEKTKEGVSLNYTAAGWRGGTPTPGAMNQLNNLPETKEKVPKKGHHGVAVDFDAQGKDADHDTLKYTWDFGDGHKSYKEKTAHTYEDNGTYTVTLKTSDDKEDVIETFVIEIQSYKAPEVRITSLLANPTGSDTDNEWVIIENREKKTVNLKDFSIATGWRTLTNHPIREDFFIKPKGEAKLTRAFSLFTLPNQKGKIELRAPDGKVLQEIKYKLEKSIADNVIYQKKKGQKWKFEESITKNILSTNTTEKTSEPDEITPPENNREETLPTVPAENTPEEAPEIIPAPISLDPDRPLPQEFLAYGTRVHLPDTIMFIPAADEERASLPEKKPASFSLPERIAADINASLNELLNSPQER